MKIPKKDGTTNPKSDACSDWEDILCDKCGKSCRDDAGDNFEYADLTACWGFNSRKDLEHHTAQICENCYDGLGLKPQIRSHFEDMEKMSREDLRKVIESAPEEWKDKDKP